MTGGEIGRARKNLSTIFVRVAGLSKVSRVNGVKGLSWLRGRKMAKRLSAQHKQDRQLNRGTVICWGEWSSQVLESGSRFRRYTRMSEVQMVRLPAILYSTCDISQSQHCKYKISSNQPVRHSKPWFS